MQYHSVLIDLFSFYIIHALLSPYFLDSLNHRVKGEIICITNRHSKDSFAIKNTNPLDWQFPTSDGQMPTQLAFRLC